MSLILQSAILASGVGAFLGGYALIHPRGGVGLLGLGSDGGSGEVAGIRAVGGAMLLAHATALATMAQSPPIGACMAAGLGAAWLGASAGRAITAVVERRRGAGTLARLAFEAAMGVVLWAPLWGYLRLMRHGMVAGSV